MIKILPLLTVSCTGFNVGLFLVCLCLIIAIQSKSFYLSYTVNSGSEKAWKHPFSL